MVNPLTWLSRRRFPYDPLIRIDISSERLIHNLNQFKKVAPGGRVAPVLKSNAYGHGLLEVAKIIARDATVPFIVVDSYFEAVAIRAQGIATPLLVMGYTRPDTIITSNLRDTAFTITTLNTLESIDDVAHQVRIHLKIDTGMKRQGIMPEEVERATALLENNDNLILEGVCSHFSDSDNDDTSFTDGQIHVWNRVVKNFKQGFRDLKYFHIAATSGHAFVREVDANVTRLGLGLYGLVPGEKFEPKLDLKPVLEMSSIITGIKKIKRDESVGYGNTFKASKDITIATVPLGYYEGIDRRLSNKGSMLVGPGRMPCPIVGTVSMNITTIDVTNAYGVEVGDAVIAISRSNDDGNSLLAMANTSGTIPYELAVHIPGQLKRVVA